MTDFWPDVNTSVLEQFMGTLKNGQSIPSAHLFFVAPPQAGQ